MEKNKILKFISKYSLSGIIDSVRWNFKDSTLQTIFMSPTKSLLGDVLYKNIEYNEEAEIGIYETSKLNKMISILDDVVDMKITKSQDKFRTIEFNDVTTNIKYMLAELDIIGKAAEIKYIPEFELDINLTKDILDRFVKAKSAIDISDYFYVTSDVLSNECYIILGEGTNKIKIKVESSIEVDIQNLSFSTELFSEVLIANKDFDKSVFKISSDGLLYLEFENDSFLTKYYLVARVGEDE